MLCKRFAILRKRPNFGRAHYSCWFASRKGYVHEEISFRIAGRLSARQSFLRTGNHRGVTRLRKRFDRRRRRQCDRRGLRARAARNQKSADELGGGRPPFTPTPRPVFPTHHRPPISPPSNPPPPPSIPPVPTPA